MRIAFISDIHGNFESLTAVLSKIKTDSPDLIVCLGDTAAMGPKPSEVLDTLQDQNCLCILGNHDEELLGEQPVVDPKTPPAIVEWVNWSFTKLSSRNKAFLNTFSSTFQLDIGSSGKLLCCHGTPSSNVDSIFPSTSEESLGVILADVPTRWIAFGHTHLQTFRRHKQYTLFNPGSVGAPLERLPFKGNAVYMPWVEYAILTVSVKEINLNLHRMNVELDAILKSVKSSTFPLADVWLDSWYQGALAMQ
jgi:putative phosphoesterase